MPPAGNFSHRDDGAKDVADMADGDDADARVRKLRGLRQIVRPSGGE